MMWFMWPFFMCIIQRILLFFVCFSLFLFVNGRLFLCDFFFYDLLFLRLCLHRFLLTLRSLFFFWRFLPNNFILYASKLLLNIFAIRIIKFHSCIIKRSLYDSHVCTEQFERLRISCIIRVEFRRQNIWRE